MNYIVLDLEWNQGERRKTVSPLSFEIIEIGAIKLNEELNPIDSFHRIIQPVIHPKLFSHTKKLLSLSEEDLKNGVPFKAACREFLKWCELDGDYIFATWGTSDLFELQKNMEFFKIKNPFNRPLYFLDIQQLYNIYIGEIPESPATLEKATNNLGFPSNKAFHCAKNDAEYTAKILAVLPSYLIKNYPTVDTFKFPLYKKQEVYLNYPDRSLYVSRAYKTKEALKLASSLRVLSCPICNKKVRKITNWYASSSKSFYLLSRCSKHGYLKAKRTIKNPSEKRFFETITIKTVTEQEKERFITSYKNHEKKKNRP